MNFKLIGINVCFQDYNDDRKKNIMDMGEQIKLYRVCPAGRCHVERKRNHLKVSKQTLDKMHVVDLHQPET